MIDDLLGAVLSTQKASLKRKASGAFVEIAALGLFGFASVFAMVGGFLWLALRMEAWLAAFVVAGVVLVLAGIGFWIGQALMRSRARRKNDDFERALGGIAPLAAVLDGRDPIGPDTPKQQTTLIVAALATGVVLGRALRR